METDNGIDEQQLIRQCQQKDKHAYGILVKRYMQRAYFAALGLVGSHESALDLSQEAFVRAYRSIKKLDPRRKFYTWYYQILRNLCFNYLRDRARHARTFSEIGQGVIESVVDQEQDTAAHLELAELQAALWNAMDTLKPHEREVIILKDFEQLTYKEIAEMLSCPIGTVMSRLFSARKSLKSRLEGYFDE